MTITIEQIKRASKRTPDPDNLRSVFIALDKFGRKLGLDQPHRFVQYLAQLMHESGSFKYDREIASGAAYEGRNDLGNTQKGDGVKFKGRTGIQLTGRANYRRFTLWARKLDPSAPDFEAKPELVNTDPWEGLAPIWYWSEGNPDRKSLNRYADQNNIEMITRRINGGLNGYADRLEYYDRLGFVVLGYGPVDYKGFQTDNALEPDGLAGPKTRAAIHARLVKLTAPEKRSEAVQVAPVVTEKPVAVPAPGLEKPWWQAPEVLGAGAAGPVVTGLAAFDWRALAIIVPACLIFAAWLIWRRDHAKAQQAATVAAIEQRTV